MKNVYSVGQLNKYIQNMFAQDYLLGAVSVKGEISNCKYHSSGHIYFTLKDESGSIKAVMFAGNRRGLTFKLEDGQQVVVSGAIDVYIQGGQYQLYAKSISLDGAGALYEKFEKLKAELEEEGMFSSCYKQPIPKDAKKVGIVTASTGAAVRDIIDVSKRRNPYIELILYPAIVQGPDAAPSIVRGIKALERFGVDVMIVGRGGGSIEDLWAFNERIVAQAIFDCTVPIISAVGHEVDFTIADFVSDLRAPTPSAAAELAVRELREIDEQIQSRRSRLSDSMFSLIRSKKEKVNSYTRQLSVMSPEFRLRQSRDRLARLSENLDSRMLSIIENRRYRLAVAASKLDGSSPLKKLESGFAYVANTDGKRVKQAKDLSVGEEVSMTLLDGTALVSVVELSLKD